MKQQYKNRSQQPLASVIIVNYNGGNMVIETLESVFAQTLIHKLEIIIIDNASEDGSANAIEAKFGCVAIIVYSEINRGFAGGNNLGFKHASGKYLLLLNNDAVAEPTWAEELLRPLELSSDVGMCTSKILCYQNKKIIDNVGHKIYVDGLNRSRGHLKPDNGQYDQTEEVLLASGCAAAYRYDAVMASGGFHKAFFAYGDDADLGLKLRLAGFRCLYIPTAKVYHRQSASTGPFSLQKLFWIERNRVWVMMRFLPVSWIIASPIYTFLRLFQSWLAGLNRTGVAGQLTEHHSISSIGFVLLKAWLAAAWQIPKMMKERHGLMANRKVTRKEWRATLNRFRASIREMNFG